MLTLIVWNSGATDDNMRIDESLVSMVRSLEDASTNKSIILLRLYEWTSNTVSLGYHQPATDFDTSALQQLGISLVRRPTGGRAIMHAKDGEVTYAVALRATKSNHEHYADINEAIAKGLALLGINAVLKDMSTQNLAPQKNIGICFTATARHELQAQGKKLVGSAQRKFGDILLQHGTIPLSSEQHKLQALLHASVFSKRPPLTKEPFEETSLQDILHRKPS